MREKFNQEMHTSYSEQISTAFSKFDKAFDRLTNKEEEEEQQQIGSQDISR